MDWDEPDNGEYSDRDLGMIKWLEENFKWKDAEQDEDESEEEAEEEDDEYDYAYDSHNSWIDYSMIIAVNAGQLDIVQYLYDHPSHKPICELMFKVAENGHMEVVKWLNSREPACSESAIAYAVQGGHLEIAKWLHEQINIPGFESGAFCELSWKHKHEPSFSIDVAAEKWTLEIVQWLHTSRPNECTSEAMDNAAANGKLDIVQWLNEHRTEGCTDQALEGAVRGGHLDMAQWLLKHRNECKDSVSPKTMDLAAAHGHLEVVKWLHEHRSEGCTTNAVDVAACNGHLEIVTFLL